MCIFFPPSVSTGVCLSVPDSNVLKYTLNYVFPCTGCLESIDRSLYLVKSDPEEGEGSGTAGSELCVMGK